MIDSAQASGEMIWLLVRGCHSHTKADILGCCCHSWYCGQRLVDWKFRELEVTFSDIKIYPTWPLSTRDDCRIRVLRSLVDIICAQDIGNENAMKFALFKQLSELDPMLNLIELSRLVVGMSP